MLARLLIIAAIIFAGCCSLLATPQPPPPTLVLHEDLAQNATIIVKDKHGNNITAIEYPQWFYPQQRGLARGTIYGFRVVDMNGTVVMPIYETFVSKGPDNSEMEIGSQYYYGLPPGRYVIELVVVEDGEGRIVARKNFSAYTQESLKEEAVAALREWCSIVAENRQGYPPGRVFEEAGRCAGELAVEKGDYGLCIYLQDAFLNGSHMINNCLKTYAVKTGDIAACDKSGMPKERGFCRAVVRGDWRECTRITCDISCAVEAIDVQKDLCIMWYAMETKNVSLCSEMQSDSYKEMCTSGTWGGN